MSMLINHTYIARTKNSGPYLPLVILLNSFLSLSSCDLTTTLTYARHKETYSQGQLADHVNFLFKYEISVYPNFFLYITSDQDQ